MGMCLPLIYDVIISAPTLSLLTHLPSLPRPSFSVCNIADRHALSLGVPWGPSPHCTLPYGPSI